MKNKYSLRQLLIEAWGDDWGNNWGTVDDTTGGVFSGFAAGGEGIDGYTYPLGLWAGHGYDREGRIFTSVSDYENDYSGDFAELQDNPMASGYSLDGSSIKSSGKTFGSKNPGNTFSGPYAKYKSSAEKMVRDYGRPQRRLSDILPTDNKKSGIFTKALRPRSLGNVYKHFDELK